MFDIMLGTADADFYGHQSQHGSFVFGSDSGLEESIDKSFDDLHNIDYYFSGCRAIMGYIPKLADQKLSAHGAAGVICALTAYRLSTV